MTIYACVIAEAAFANHPGGPQHFLPVDALPARQRDLWRNVSSVTLEEWAAPFAQTPDPVALTIVVTADHNTINCIAGYVEEEGTKISQAAKPSAGYLARMFDRTKETSSITGANVSSRRAHESGFISRNMAAFNAIDKHMPVKAVSISASGAGVYAWMSYGATPDIAAFAGKARSQWIKLCNKAHALNFTVSDRLRAWVEGLPQGGAVHFRSAFDIAVDDSLRRALKALVLGDIAFLHDRRYRFQLYETPSSRYADPMNCGLEFNPQDAGFQIHFQRRVTGMLARPE